MKILLDENLPRQFKTDFTFGHEVLTVRDMKWLGKKNGELMNLMILHGFNILITNDGNLRYQQNLSKFNITIFLIEAFDNRRDTLRKAVKPIQDIIESGKFEKINIISVK